MFIKLRVEYFCCLTNNQWISTDQLGMLPWPTIWLCGLTYYRITGAAKVGLLLMSIMVNLEE